MTLQNKKIAFLGAGNMGEALIRGILAAKIAAPPQLIATDIRAERLEFFKKTFGIRTNSDNGAAVSDAEIVVLAVKPQQVGEVLAQIRGAVSGKLVISIAAGVPTSRIEKELGGKIRVVRVMPNTPALVGAGAAALAKGAHATDEDLATAEKILGAVGICVRLEEKYLDAVTALSGSGPAYVFLLAEAMAKAGESLGLSREIAAKLAVQTVIGAGKLLEKSGESPEILRQKVTSPGGTTGAALKVLAEKKFADALADAICAAEARSRELAKS
jgi:pyrroline-5-carboxylate reductase